MKKLKITHSTYLKNLNKKSEELPRKDRIPVLENQELLVEDYIEDCGDHYKVKANLYVSKINSEVFEQEQLPAPVKSSRLPKFGKMNENLTIVFIAVILVLLTIGSFYSPRVFMALCGALQAVALISICLTVNDIKELNQSEEA